ncbi:hypothetical protein BJX99DRAFT_222849 [Aspergillus californicus]
MMAPRQTEKGFLSVTYEQITSPENATIVRSILVFGVRCIISSSLIDERANALLQAGVAFLHSSLSELLLPP